MPACPARHVRPTSADVDAPRRRSLARAEDQQVERAQARQTKEIERLYIEVDGVFARMRRGSVPMEREERQRSELVPEVYVDTPAPDSLRYVARRTAKGGFDWLLYQLAEQCGLSVPSK